MSSDFPVVFALYPGVTQLDFTGPYEVFHRLPGARCVLASAEGGTIGGAGDITFSGVERRMGSMRAERDAAIERAAAALRAAHSPSLPRQRSG